MSETLVIGAKRFIDANKEFSGQIQYADGRIISTVTGNSFGTPDYFFDKNYIVFPGFIDQHVHLRYGQPEKEDIISGTLAAINGGVTRVMDMPNNPVDIAPLTKETLEAKIEWGRQGFIPVHHYAATKPGSIPIEGVEHYKVFIGKSVGDLWFETEEQLKETLQHYRGKKVTFHCEYQEFINNSKEHHHQRRPAIAEKLALRMAEDVCLNYPLCGNVAHASTVDSLSSDLYREVTFHHLLLNRSDSPFKQVNPPIRGNGKNLRKHMSKATVIASDHAPHTPEEKRSNTPLSGMPMLDTYGNCAGYLIQKLGVDPMRIAELCSYHPAHWIFSNTKMEAGIFARGYDASFTVINMKKNTSMFNHEIYSKAGYTPFSGMTMPEVTATIAQGRILKEDNKVFC